MIFATFAEQDYFIYPSKDSYQGVFIKANMAAYAPQGLAAFLMEKTNHLPYIIDPITHAFQHTPEAIQNKEGIVKKSISNLVNAYGEPIKSIAGNESLTPDHFSDKIKLENLVNNCIAFQKEQISKIMLDSDANDYLGKGIHELRPKAVIPPYFFISGQNYEDWLKINISSVEHALLNDSELDIYAYISLSKNILDNENALKKIETAYSEMDVAGYVLWIDDFDEHNASINTLKQFIRLVRALNNNTKVEVINLHGGYFSIMAAGISANYLTGVAHGPEYGEYRSVIPVGGGLPFAKYYLPKLHKRLKFAEASNLLREFGWLKSTAEFFENVCDCPECKEVINTDPDNFTKFGESNPIELKRGKNLIRLQYPTQETKKLCLRHYLQKKEAEFRFVENSNDLEIKQDLINSIKQFEKSFNLDSVEYLNNWREVLFPE